MDTIIISKRERLAKKLILQLTLEERNHLEGISNKVESAPSYLDKEIAFFSAEGIRSDLAYKAFMFTVTTSINSYLQKRAFKIMNSEEFNCHIKYLTNRWNYSKGLAKEDYKECLPDTLTDLMWAKNFKFDYLKPFLSGKKIKEGEQFSLLQTYVKKIENENEGYIPAKEVNYLLNLSKRTGLDVTPIFPSVRYHFSLEDAPDNWILEMFLK